MTRQSKTLRIVFIGAIVFLIVLFFLTYRLLTSLIELGQLVNRTTQLTLEFEKTLSNFKNAETGYRAYLLSRDRRFLESFYTGLN